MSSMLTRPSDPITEEGIRAGLPEHLAQRVSVHVYERVSSTNESAKELGPVGGGGLRVVVADAQDAGKGQHGKAFYSPAGCGVYISILQELSAKPEHVLRYTALAAVAVCRALETVASARPQIKWFNDVYLEGKKCCGILSEGSIEAGTGTTRSVVTGIGINVYDPAEGYPTDIQDKVTYVSKQCVKGLRDQIAAAVIENFADCCSPGQEEALEDYRRRLALVGKRICVHEADGAQYEARVEELYDDLSISLICSDDTHVHLQAANASITYDISPSK